MTDLEVSRGIRRIVDDVYKRMSLPSVAVGVSYDGLDYFYVTGLRAFLSKAANEDTIYRIASCSKAFIATSVLLLQEQGKLDIDEPVVSYLPDFRFNTEEMTSQITPRDMLCHRTGLPRHDIANFANQHRTLAQMAESVRYLEPAYGLRERFHYQNHLYGVLSLLVEQISGKPWGEFVREQILSPLGMSRTVTHCGDQRKLDDNYARSLFLQGKVNLPFINSNDDCTGGAGAMSASIRDLLTWTKSNMGRGSLGGIELLPEPVFEQAHHPQIIIRDGELSDFKLPYVTETAYALGWITQRFRDEPLIQHGGSIFGFRAITGFLPEKEFAFAVLVNQNETLATEAIAHALCDMVLGSPAHDWVTTCQQIRSAQKKRKQEETRRLTAPPAAVVIAPDAAGSYEHPAYGTCQVSGSGKKLSLKYAGFTIGFIPSTVDEYVLHSSLAGMNFPCHFERSEDGRIVALLVKLDKNLDSYIRFKKENRHNSLRQKGKTAS